MPTTLHCPLLHPLREIVRRDAENRPGVYRMVGMSGLVIYVGKSKRVRTRLMGYFRAPDGEKAWRIIREASSVEWEYAPSEFASLLLELQMIKRYRPRHNVRHKRDGLYSFLKISAGPAPKIFVVRRVIDDAATYFGPFRGGRWIEEAVRELNDSLALRDCTLSTPIRFFDQAELFGTELPPLCPRYELLRCSGPCAAKCSETEYSGRFAIAEAYLHGESEDPLDQLRERMRSASDRWEFEHAAALKTRMERLELLRSEFLRLRKALDRISFLYVVPGLAGDHRIYAIRSGSVRAVYPAPVSWQRRRGMIEAAAEHFAKPEAPSEIATPGRVDEILLLSHWFRTRPGEREFCFSRDSWSKIPLARQISPSGLA